MSTKKVNVKNIIKHIGNAAAVISVIFIIKRVISMDVDLSKLLQGEYVLFFAVGLATYLAVVIMNFYPWAKLVKALSGKDVPSLTAAVTYTRSNLYKYVPGNVFQYVGRNQLAFELQLSHLDVFTATVLDIVFSILMCGLISAVLLGGLLGDIISSYGARLAVAAAICAAAAAAAAAVFLKLFKEKFLEYLNKIKSAFTGENRGQVLRAVIYYFILYTAQAALYFFCAHLTYGGGKTMAELRIFTGAYLISWIIGFVTPGAPGGIGIRESVMLLLCGRDSDEVLLFVLMMRIISICADILGFLLVAAYEKISDVKKGKEGSSE